MNEQFKFKDMKRLGETIQRATAFAEQIKTRVHNDLETIASTKVFILDVQATLSEMRRKLNESEDVLLKLKELLE